MRDLNQSLTITEKLFEYLLLIPIDDKVSKRVKTIKQTFAGEFGCSEALNHPHISLISFIQQESMEFRIANCFDKFARFIKPVEVNLCGFGAFSNHTIYINVGNSSLIPDMVGEMRQRFYKLLQSGTSFPPKFIDRPHLTIARGMTGEQFEDAWKQWIDATFEASYVAQEMILVKRQIDLRTLAPLSKYRPVRHFPFRGKAKSEPMRLFFSAQQQS